MTGAEGEVNVQVRFFAGAAEAAGVDEREVAVETLTGHDLVALLGEGNERLAKVLKVSSLLADGARLSDLDATIGPVSRVDVLPPFAGG